MTSRPTTPPRLTRIATRTGDDGTTGLGDGSRIAKHRPRIAALGDVDELNCSLGVLRAEALPDDIDRRLAQVQHDLFSLGGELAVPGHAMLGQAQVAALDDWLAADNATLSPLQEFILPGGCRSAALAHA
ncbi:MAG: cob(I)yrinic acid a,c-diamide adenosyltransferase, partial [Pigmentiphaga sp.]